MLKRCKKEISALKKALRQVQGEGNMKVGVPASIQRFKLSPPHKDILDQKQRIEEDKEMMLQMLQEEKLLRDQQQEKIQRLTQLIISASKKPTVEPSAVDKKVCCLGGSRLFLT